jgi:hypothetical protein
MAPANSEFLIHLISPKIEDKHRTSVQFSTGESAQKQAHTHSNDVTSFDVR